MRRIVFLGALCVVATAVHADAFADGQALANQAVSDARSNPSAFGSGAVSDKLPGFTMTPPASRSGFLGLPGLGGAAGSRINECASAPPDEDPVVAQECSAINFLQRNPTSRVRMDLKSDPLFGTARAAAAAISLGAPDGTQQTTTPQCVDREVTTAATFRTEICNDFLGTHAESCDQSRVIEVDQNVTYRCEEQMAVQSNTSCTIGSVVSVAEASNFSCDRTFNAYESNVCNRTIQVTVVEGYDNPAGTTVLAQITSSVYLYVTSGDGILKLHTDTGTYPVPGSWTYSGTMLGMDSGGSVYKLVVTSNNCAGGACSGNAVLYLWRSFNDTWLGVIQASFSQSLQQAPTCSYSGSFQAGAGYRAVHCSIASSSCPDADDNATFTYSCQVDGGGAVYGSGTATLAPHQTIAVEAPSPYDCQGQSWVTYNGSGSFTFASYGRAGGGCHESSTLYQTFAYPTHKNSVTIAEINECSQYEARSQ